MPARSLFIATLSAALCALAAAAQAKPARCFTTDDGEYSCQFTATDGKGSFEIAAPSKPTFSLVVERPGLASGFADYGNGGVALPGRYRRSGGDPACWENDATGTRICAW